MLGGKRHSQHKSGKKKPACGAEIGFERILEEIDGENHIGQGSSNSSKESGANQRRDEINISQSFNRNNISQGLSLHSAEKSESSTNPAIDLWSSFNSCSDPKLQIKKFEYLYKRTSFRCMGEFYRHLFAVGVKGKKVSRKYQQHMQDFANTHFSKVFEKLQDAGKEQLSGDFMYYLTQVTQSHRLSN